MQTIGRRGFIATALGAGAFSAVAGRHVLPETSQSPVSGPKLKFGVVSDVHLDLSPVRTESYRRALEGFRDAGVDAVLVPGDFANLGRFEEMKLACAVWDEVFADRPEVVRLFHTGNHDCCRKEDAPVFAKKWESALGDPYEPIRRVDVKGYTFLLVDWNRVDSVDEYFRAHADELDRTKPLFYSQHPHPKGTCYDPKVAFWCGDKGKSTECLSQFPKAIAFSGHSHYPITDPYSIWQGAFTSINCGSTWCSSRDYVPYDEKANGPAYAYDRRPELMPRLPVQNTAAPGLIVSVFDDSVRIERRDFLRNLPLGEDWVFPLAGERPYLPERRASGHRAPQFPVGAKLGVSKVTNGFDIVKLGTDQVLRREEVSQVRLAIPLPETCGPDRVFGYEVTAFDETDGKKLFRRFLLSAEYHLPPSVPPQLPAFYIDASELPRDHIVRFEVVACERFGARSRPLAARHSTFVGVSNSTAI